MLTEVEYGARQGSAIQLALPVTPATKVGPEFEQMSHRHASHPSCHLGRKVIFHCRTQARFRQTGSLQRVHKRCQMEQLDRLERDGIGKQDPPPCMHLRRQRL